MLGSTLPQSYARLAPRMARQVGRYAHAQQFKRMRKGLRGLKGDTGRVMRDVARRLHTITDDTLRARIEGQVALVTRLLAQKPRDKRKLYALHGPDVDRISKGKAHKRYEFGCKVSAAKIHREGFVVGMRSMPGNPHGGHTLHEPLEQVETLADRRHARVFVDRGYRNHGIDRESGTAVYISGQRRGITRAPKRALRRRSVFETTIGHMKAHGRPSSSTLKGIFRDALHAVLCGAGHNIRLILAHHKALLTEILAALHRARNGPIPAQAKRQIAHPA
jgi:IS5 family transposase